MTAPALVLAATEADIALAHLGVTVAAADQAHLAALVTAYTRTVPWESASRIARRTRTGDATRPRQPAVFWVEARAHSTGGTCFESNAAFVALLRALGYDAYLTINDMQTTRGCHTAIIVRLDGVQWLVDAGFPMYAPLPLDSACPTTATSTFHTYTATPLNDDHYEITRDRHPKPYCFTLHDQPVPDDDYWAATTRDYGPGGLFLDRVILTKVIAGGIWRFDNGAAERGIESFAGGERTLHPLPNDLAVTVTAVAARFGTDAAIIHDALDAVAGGL